METATQIISDARRPHSPYFITAYWLIVVGLFFAFFGPVVPGLVRDWSDSGTYSYGFLVPIIAAYLIWDRRQSLRNLEVNPNYWAVFILLVAVLLALLGQAIGDSFVPRWSMIIGLAGTIWLLFGNVWMRALLFPVYYLSLMIPVPYFLVKDLTFWLRYSDATNAAAILTLLGLPVYRESYFLHLPNITLEVADVCSGVSSIFALFALGVIYAYFLPIKTLPKLVLVALTFPFALISNLFRIVLTSILAYYFGPVVLHTTFHSLSGTMTFVVALLMLIALGEWIRKRYPSEHRTVSPAVPNSVTLGRSASGWEGAWRAFVVCLVILSVGLYFSHVLDHPHKMALFAPLESVMVGSDTNDQVLAEDDRYRDRHAHTSISRNVVLHDGTPVNVFVAYSAAQGAATRLDSPKLIFPKDWNSVWLRDGKVALPTGQTVHGNWILSRKGNNQQLVFYWYQLGDRTLAGEVENRLAQVRRAFTERRSDAAVVRLSTVYRDGEPIEIAQRRLTAVAAELYPQLLQRLPG